MDQLREDQIGPFLAIMGWAMGLVFIAAITVAAWPWLRERRGALVGYALILIGVVSGALAGGARGALLGLVGAAFLAAVAMLGVKRSTPAPADDYDERPAEGAGRVINFPASRLEAEMEAGREAGLENGHAFVTLTEKALQERDADHVEQGMIRAFAALHKGGYLAPGKATEIKRALFGVGGGRRLQALNDAIDAVAVPAAPPASDPRRSPIAGRELPRDAQFIDDDRLAAAER